MNEVSALEIVKKYFAAFNEGRTKDMLALLHPEVQHDRNQSTSVIGLEAFTKFMTHMDACYKEELKNMSYFTSQTDRNRVSVEFDVHGTYLKTDGNLPQARGQKYVVPAGSFLETKDGKIKRVTTYYNLPQWIESVK
ncbi:isopropylmalate/homocitrate/citramalate synthase [Bdellovibrio sp. qaytius]|nr:isopropylmalate/homocitrate/citramalate synthase [Bdellovibrio sp. qaytius]